MASPRELTKLVASDGAEKVSIRAPFFLVRRSGVLLILLLIWADLRLV
jgi:hypothetical protein